MSLKIPRPKSGIFWPISSHFRQKSGHFWPKSARRRTYHDPLSLRLRSRDSTVRWSETLPIIRLIVKNDDFTKNDKSFFMSQRSSRMDNQKNWISIFLICCRYKFLSCECLITFCIRHSLLITFIRIRSTYSLNNFDLKI